MSDEEKKLLEEIKTNSNAAAVWALAAMVCSMIALLEGCLR